jgi:hypothetical protein
MLYDLFDAALRSAGVGARRRDRFTDRGDGLLALIDPADQALLIPLVIPVFSQLLASHNAGFRAAFRLLDAPRVKTALKIAPGPLLLVVSSDI